MENFEKPGEAILHVDDAQIEAPIISDQVADMPPHDAEAEHAAIIFDLTKPEQLIDVVEQILREEVGSSHPHFNDMVQGVLERLIKVNKNNGIGEVPKLYIRKTVKSEVISLGTKDARISSREVPIESSGVPDEYEAPIEDLTAPDPLHELIRSVEIKEAKGKVTKALLRLSQHERELVRLKLQGHDWETIAKMLGGLTALGVAGVVTLRGRHNRALKKMRSTIDAESAARKKARQKQHRKG